MRILPLQLRTGIKQDNYFKVKIVLDKQLKLDYGTI